MSKLGDIIVIDVDPDTNQGLDQAAAIVTAEYSDGSLRIRVLGDGSADDSVRNYVGEDGQPFIVEEDEPTTASTSAASPAPSSTQPAPAPAPSSAPTEDDVQAMVEALSPADRQALIAALTGGGQNADASQTVTPPTTDATPNSASL